MSDEIQQPAPEPQPQPALPVPGAEQPALAAEVVIHSGKGAKGSIDKLPLEIKNDINVYYESHNGPATQKYIKEKYAEQYPHLKTLTVRTVYLYAEKNKLKNLRDAIEETGMLDLAQQVSPMIDMALDPNANLVDKRAAIIKVYNDLKDTFDKLKSSQKNFIDPQACAVLSKLGTDILKMVDAAKQYDDETQTVKQRDIHDEADDIINLCTIALEGAYRMTHKDQALWANFLATYITGLKECFNNYRHVKEIIKANPLKIS
jgi:hypothetical protein